MPHNLLTTGWIPVRYQDETSAEIAPWQITEHLDTNPVTASTTSRPDFTAALFQFLIGLLQTAYTPADPEEWFERLEAPPTPDLLREIFARYADAFNLDGDGPRFMQDQDDLADQKPLPITALLIETAGSETHFVKDLPQQGMSPASAAMALYTLQTNAPSGGVGHRTSLRGGGPLTTLVVATPEDPNKTSTLWQTLWLNVLDQESLGFDAIDPDPARVFPWLSPTRTSEKGGKQTTPEDVHPLQMFWGMPRRIRLDFDNGTAGHCAVTNEQALQLVSHYRTRNYGTNYTGAWQHTLSPYTHNGQDLIAMHPRGSINYRHWLSLMQESKDNKTRRIPAAVVKRFNAGDYLIKTEGWRYRLWACGYDMDNMKPRCWFESTLPLFSFESAARREAVETAAEKMVIAANLFVINLRNAVKDAWFSQNDPRHKSAKVETLQDTFWQETEAPFYTQLTAMAHADDTEAARLEGFQVWHRFLNNYTQTAFDHWVDYNQLSEQSHPRRIAEARRNLRRFNYSKKIKDALEIPDQKQAA